MIPLQNPPQHYPTFNLQQSERVYQELLEENLRLRSRVFPQQNAIPSYYPQVPLPQRYAEYKEPERGTVPQYAYRPVNQQHLVPAFYSPEQLDARVKGIYTQKTQPLVEPEPPGGRLIEKICPYLSQEESSTALNSLAQRNKYLEGKIFMLRKQIEKQSKKISKAKHHINHQTSCEDCYQDRYYVLVRMTSPN